MAATFWAERRRRPSQGHDARRLATLVPRLSRLKSLKLDELDPALVDVLFLDQEASRALKSLKTLDFSVHDVPLIPDDCDAGDWVRRLSCLPRLADLTLCQTGAGLPALPATPDPPTFPYLKRLVLKPGLTSYQTSWKGAALDQTAPNLVELELVDFSLDWFSSALATAPVGLRILSLVNDMDVMPGEPPTQVPVNDVLARFKNLEQLRLGHGALDMSEPSSGLEALVTVDTLIHLSFDDTDLLTDSFLLALLSNPNHLPNLATLELNHIYSVQSYTFEEMQGALPSFVERQHHPHWPMWGEWHAPSYPPGCTEAGLRDVVRAAHARGIVVEGTAYDVLEWRDAFDAEQRAALLALGDLTGDYARARPVLGNEVVNAHILERARASVEGVEGGGVRGGRRDEVGEDLEE